MRKLKIILDNNIYCSYKNELKNFKEKNKDKIEIFLTDVNIVEMIEFKERLQIALEIKDKLFGPPQFVVLNEINQFFNKNIFYLRKYKKLKSALYQIFFKSGNSFKELIDSGEIFNKEQIKYIKEYREKNKELYFNNWRKSADIIKPIIKQIKENEKIKRDRILEDFIKNYFFYKDTFDYLMERFCIKKYFPEYYLLLYLDNTYLKIKSILSFVNYYIKIAENYFKKNLKNVTGSDLLDLDYTVYFPFIDYFVTENKKDFLYEYNNGKIINFENIYSIINNLLF